jgi:hypothetical protein
MARTAAKIEGRNTHESSLSSAQNRPGDPCCFGRSGRSGHLLQPHFDRRSDALLFEAVDAEACRHLVRAVQRCCIGHLHASLDAVGLNLARIDQALQPTRQVPVAGFHLGPSVWARPTRARSRAGRCMAAGRAPTAAALGALARPPDGPPEQRAPSTPAGEAANPRAPETCRSRAPFSSSTCMPSAGRRVRTGGEAVARALPHGVHAEAAALRGDHGESGEA